MLRFRHAWCASQGRRNYQEDAAAVRSDGAVAGDSGFEPTEQVKLVAVLADGMGGHAGGAIASKLICESFLDDFGTREGDVARRLRSALLAANNAIAEKVAQSPGMRGMGATLVGVAFRGEGAEWVSVGDSPLYLVRRGEIARLNEDHSLAPMLDRLVAEGRMSAERARADPRRHFLRAAVSGEGLDLVDSPQRPLALQAGDVLIVASDGINTLGDEEIARVVSTNLSAGPEAIAQELIGAVDLAGDVFQDNTTAIVITVEAEAE
jgi:protein phosphatase